MNCIPEGMLRARMDHELSETELPVTDRHLAECPECRRRSLEIERQAAGVARGLAALAPSPTEAPTDSAIVFARLQARAESEETAPSLWDRMFVRRLQPIWVTAAVAIVIASFSFTPASSWAQRILAMLRVQKVAVITFDPELMRGEGNMGTVKMLGQLMSDQVVVTQNPGKPQPAASGAQASQMANFPVRLLAIRSDAPSIKVNDEAAFHMTVDRERVLSILQSAGRSDVNLPASLDGAEIAVHIPRTVFMSYGSLPEAPRGSAWTKAQQQMAENFVKVIEAPSPTVSVPPDLNMGQLAAVGLELTGMDATEAQSICQNIDWTSTLVIPVPSGEVTPQTVNVDGSQGTLLSSIHQKSDEPAGYALVWVKGGIIYAISGFGDPQRAVAYANSLE